VEKEEDDVNDESAATPLSPATSATEFKKLSLGTKRLNLAC
jgi:hypothetical protein